MGTEAARRPSSSVVGRTNVSTLHRRPRSAEMDPDNEMLNASRRLSEALAPGDLDATLGSITRAAVEVVPDVAFASITVKHSDGTLSTSAPTDPAILALDAAQYKFQEGPCYEAATETVHVTSPYLADDDRFPRYGPI